MNQNNSKKSNDGNLTDYEKFAINYHKDAFQQGGPKKGNPAKDSYQESRGNSARNKNLRPIKMGGFDDYIPEPVGNIVDTVFGKIDSFVNTVLGEAKSPSKKVKKKKTQTKYVESDWGKIKRNTEDEDDFAPAPKQVIKEESPVIPPPPKTKVQTKQIMNPQTHSKTTKAQPVQEYYEPPPVKSSMPRGKIPCVSRTTSIAELNLAYPILNDPDLVKYFDQMKLYENHVIEGGLCGMPVFQAIALLNRGLWSENFRIRFEDLKLNIGLKPVDIAKARFKGMLPVYKAYGAKFESLHTLKKAIEEDINTFLATGKGIPKFHKFTYKVVAKK